MRLYVFDSKLQSYVWYPDNEQASSDIFLYWKGVALITAAVIMLGILVASFYKERKNCSLKEILLHEKWIVFLLGFALLAFLSTIFSKYRFFGFNGISDQFESIWVVLSYCITTFYAFSFIRKESDLAVIEKALFILITVLSVIGISQIAGHDFFETELGKSLYVPARYAEVKKTLSFNFSGSGTHQVYLTLYNPNYVGVFAVLILPITTMLCVGNKEKKKKLIWGILSIAVFVCALGSGSKAFLISLLAVALLGMVIYGKRIVKRLPAVLLIMVVVVGAALGYMKYADINLFEYVKNAVVPVKNNYDVKDFIVEKDGATLIYKDEPLFLQCELLDNGALHFQAFDKDNNRVPFFNDETTPGVLHFDDERFSDITTTIYVGLEEHPYVAELTVGLQKYAFSKDENGYKYLNHLYVEDELKKADSALLTEYDSLFSGRGYIWSRTFPLLKDAIFLGNGADTYTVVFPQDDYIAKGNAGYQGMLVTKPHNIYLQMWVQYGLLAVICYLALALYYVVQSIKICWNLKYDNLYSYMALGVLLGIVGYGIAGITNDSCVALAPIAWVLLGVGFAINRIVKKENT